MTTKKYKVRSGFYLHLQRGKEIEIFEGGSIIELDEHQAKNLYAHQIEPVKNN